MYERLNQKLAPLNVFFGRVAANLAIVLALISVSLAAGMVGYHVFEGMSWIDSFANAAMILSGMGPLGLLHSFGGKLFAGLYALYSGLFLILAAGFLLAPVVHRFLHSIRLDDSKGGG